MISRATKTTLLVFAFLQVCGQDQDSIFSRQFLLYEFNNCKVPEPFSLSAESLRRPIVIGSHSVKPTQLFLATGELSYQHFNRDGNQNDLLLINSSSNVAVLRLDVLYKETYPFTFSFRYNQSRPFQIDNQYEVNIGFDDRAFKERLRSKILSFIKDDQLRQQLLLADKHKNAFKEYSTQKQMLTSPAYIQKTLESQRQTFTQDPKGSGANSSQTIFSKFDKVSQLVSRVPALMDMHLVKQRIVDSVEERLDQLSLVRQARELHTKLEKKRDSLDKLVKGYEDSLRLLKERFAHRVDSVNQELSQIQSTNGLREYSNRIGLHDSSTTDRWPNIMMKSTIRLGKFLLNHSELTVNNIFLHGASIKYGDERFILLSAGYYDFAFRQVFNFRNDTIPRNRSSVFAMKVGKTDGRNLSALTFFIGRKTKYGSPKQELRTVAGFGIERKFYFTPNLSLNVELAKSTARPAGVLDKSGHALKDLFTSFHTSTLGFYGTARIRLPKTSTDAEINYHYLGQRFESFNASQYFNPQNNIAAKLSQPLFNRRLHFAAGLRFTNFNTFGIASNMKTKTLFASTNMTLRLKRVPIISIGYYPGSQLYWLGKDKLYEYFYYILNSTVSHYFRAGRTPVQAVLSWNKFYNKYTDSLIAGSQSYINLFVTAWSGKFSFIGNLSRQAMEDNRLSTIEGGLNYTDKQFKLGGSLKGNFVGSVAKIGFSLNTGIIFKEIGSINLIYDRSFLPERTGQFVPVTTGQLQIIKPLKFTVWK